MDDKFFVSSGEFLLGYVFSEILEGTAQLLWSLGVKRSGGCANLLPVSFAIDLSIPAKTH
jgi:hypothetical protein